MQYASPMRAATTTTCCSFRHLYRLSNSLHGCATCTSLFTSTQMYAYIRMCWHAQLDKSLCPPDKTTLVARCNVATCLTVQVQPCKRAHHQLKLKRGGGGDHQSMDGMCLETQFGGNTTCIAGEAKHATKSCSSSNSHLTASCALCMQSSRHQHGGGLGRCACPLAAVQASWLWRRPLERVHVP